MQKQIKKGKNLLRSLIIFSCLFLIGAASCDRKKHRPPKFEQCILGDEVLKCHDPRMKKGERSYDLEYDDAINYISTNPDDYKMVKNWANSKIKKLIKCERQ